MVYMLSNVLNRKKEKESDRFCTFDLHRNRPSGVFESTVTDVGDRNMKQNALLSVIKLQGRVEPPPPAPYATYIHQ
jgi:hypothetical protein